MGENGIKRRKKKSFIVDSMESIIHTVSVREFCDSIEYVNQMKI